MRADSLFIDKIEIQVSSGNGGPGCVSFRREAMVPRGGPDGGDGGKGGAVCIVGDSKKHTLLDYKYKKHYIAQSGQGGMGQKRYGKAGEDIVLQVPIGTQVRDRQTKELLFDILDENKKQILEGGRGGLGNWHFKSSRNQTPEHAQPGEPGSSREIILELKLLADVGLIGFPNAGKSTLISVLSKARPKVGAYPFTTLNPQLGVMEHKQKELVLADLPGLIEGAAQGVGLGHRFLRHAERTSRLLHLISLDPYEEKSPLERYHLIRTELRSYSNPNLAREEKKLEELNELIVLTKADLCGEEEREKIVNAFSREDLFPLIVSSASHYNIENLKDKLIQEGKDGE